MKTAVANGFVFLLLIAHHFSAALAQSLPEGIGKSEFQRVCSECHSLNMATDMRLSGSQWGSTVSRMATLGAKLTEREASLITDYLAANFSPHSPAADASHALRANTTPEKPSSRSNTPPDLSLLESNGCLVCHAVQGKGGYTAPDLTGIGDYRTPEELRAALLSPDEEVVPENRHIRVVTKQGRTITGKLLNQDAFTIQLIDATGQLHSVRRVALRESTIITKGLMPSYKDRLTPKQIEELVQIISALKTAF
jgi:putative heme-binding domain-containing protein